MSKTAQLMLELARLGEILQAAEALNLHGVLPGDSNPKGICKAYVNKTPVLAEHIANRAAKQIFDEEMQGKGLHQPKGIMKT